MKKIWFVIAIVIVVVIIGGVVTVKMSTSAEGTKAGENTPQMNENQFDAKVTKIQKEYIMVEALDGQTIAGEVQVWIGMLSDDEIPEMKIGDTVRITHDGKMTMSLPPQMSAIEPILIIE